MEASDMRLIFADRCLDGIYDARGWRTLLSCYSNREVDGELVGEFMARDEQPYLVDAMSPDYVSAYAANVQIALLAESFFSASIDTTAPETWFAVADAVKAASVLAMVPGYRTEGSDSVEHSVWFAAYLADSVLRASSAKFRASALCAEMSKPSEDFVRRRALRTFADIICGRSSLWLSALYDIAAEAAAVSGRDFGEVYDAYADANLSAMVGIFEQAGADNALSSYLASVANLSAVYDGYQRATFGMMFDAAPEVTLEVAQGALDADVYGTISPYLPKSEPATGLVGFCAIAGTSPVACVATLPRGVETSLVSELAAVDGESETE